MALDLNTAVQRWLAAYNSEKPWNDDNFDDEMYGYLHGGADAGTRLDVMLALSRYRLSDRAKGFLGADICEDVLTEAPELLPRIRELAENEPRLKEIIGHAWCTGSMTDEVRDFLRGIHKWMEQAGIEG